MSKQNKILTNKIEEEKRWNIRFLELKKYLEINDDYPSKNENKHLYAWVAQQRNKKKNKQLKLKKIEKLNTINFAWDICIYKWNKAFKSFQEYSKTNIFPPCKNIDDDSLVKWYNQQKNRIKHNKTLSQEQINKFLAIDKQFRGPAIYKKWNTIYDDLVNWKSEHPNNWPQYNRSDTKSRESKLSIFCQTIRKKYKANDLDNYWLDKMKSLDFNFEAKTDAWTKKYENIKSILEDRKTISIDEIGANKYNWIYRQRKYLEQGKLSDFQSKKIKELNLDRFFETWEQIFSKVEHYIKESGKLPTRMKEKKLHSWLGSQRSVYRNGNLSKEQINKLIAIGYDLDATGNQKKRDRWLEMYDYLITFRNNNPDSWPKHRADGLEKKLYNWCQANRQAQAGTHSGGRRKPLKQWKVDMLNEINFIWNTKSNQKTWEEWFSEFTQYIDQNGNIKIPSMKNGKKNPLYAWWAKQKHYYKNNKLSAEIIKSFNDVGIDLSNLKTRGKE